MATSVLDGHVITKTEHIAKDMEEYKTYRRKLKESEYKALGDELEKSIVFEMEQSEDGSLYKVLKGVNCDVAAQTILEHIPYVYLPELERLYVYIDGVYLPDGVPYTEMLLQRYYGDKVKGLVGATSGKDLVNVRDHTEIRHKIERSCSKPLSIFRPDKQDPLFAVANGILNLNTLELVDPSPDRYILNCCPTWYDPDAECPKIDEFLDTNVDRKFHENLRRWSGYTLWPDYNVHKALMLYGDPRTGKDTFAGILTHMHGIENCSSVSLHSLMENRFMGAQLYGKKINISGDVSANMIKDPARFREATGESLMTVERKNGQPFEMYNTAKMIALSNNLSKLSDRVNDQGAFYSRWEIVQFPYSFLGREDSNLKEKLYTDSEMCGWLATSTKALHRFIKADWKFEKTIDSAAYYRRESDPVIAFLEDNYESSEDGKFPKYDLRVAYSKWATENKKTPLSTIMLNKEMLAQNVIPVAPCWIGTFPDQKEAWLGITPKVTKKKTPPKRKRQKRQKSLLQ
jgi:putative DNA primase/helicase